LFMMRDEYQGSKTFDLYVEMWEFNSLADMETSMARIFSDEGMKRIGREFHQLVESTSFSASIWYPVA